MAAGLMAGPTPGAEATAVCTADIAFGYAPGVTVLSSFTWVTGTVTLDCPVLGPDAGVWILPFSGPSDERCVFGNGLMTFAPGTGPTGATGAGTFNFSHAYANSMVVTGGLSTGGGPRAFTAVLEFVPGLVPANCVTVPMTTATATGVGTLL